MSNVFDDMSESFIKSSKIVAQLAGEELSKKTIIVKPQVAKDATEAEELAKNWKSRERKQLFENLFKELS